MLFSATDLPFYTDGQFTKIGIEKLVALIPKTRSHLVCYHAVFTPNARLRKKVVAKSPKAKRGEGSEHAKGYTKNRMACWHRLMRRVFEIDVFKCPKCKGLMTNVSSIIQRAVIREYSQAPAAAW